jgi:hypothetical protein
MWKSLYSVVLVFCLVTKSYCIGTNEKAGFFVDFNKKDTISFNSAYLENLYTNKQLANFNLEFLRAGDRFLDYIHERSSLSLIIAFLILDHLNGRTDAALHEIGHGLRIKSYGVDFMLLEKEPTGLYKKDEDYFNFFLRSIFSFGRAHCEADPNEFQNLKDYFTKSGKMSEYYNMHIVYCAGGINNNTYLAEKISDDIHFKDSSRRFLPYTQYIYNLVYGARYDNIAKGGGDDPYYIILDFNSKGRDDFKKGTIYNAGIKSLFLSATTYSFWYSLFTGKPMIKPFGFRLPDVFPYITTKGMSYKVVSGYKVNETLNLIFGFESVFGREAATEINLGLNRQTYINNFPIIYKGIITFGQGLDLETFALTPISKYFDIGLGVELYSVTSLMGQRHASTNMKEGSGYSTNLYAFIRYRY